MINARHSAVPTKHSSLRKVPIATTNIAETAALLTTRVLTARDTALRLPSVEDDLVAIAVEDDLRVAQVLLAALLGAGDAAPGCAVGGRVLHGVLPDLFALAGEDWWAGGVVGRRVVPGAGVPFVELGGGPLAAGRYVAVWRS